MSEDDKRGMTYAETGVNYGTMDPFKRAAQLAAQETSKNISRLGFFERTESRGESVFVINTHDGYLGHVEEGLGTKNLVADAMYALSGKSYYDQIAIDTVAMIVNDMITLGIMPLSTAMHLAVGDSDWFNDQNRTNDLIAGWKKACDLARCTWGGGETPTLKGVVNPEAIVLSGSAFGFTDNLIRNDIHENDAIVIIESSGIHANGLTLARKIAEKLPDGYLTKLPDGRTYGETLLDPTHIYVGLVEDCMEDKIDIHYAINVTGHGWRKLMRSPGEFQYIIEQLPSELPIFPFIQKHGPVDDYEAYGNLNMGAGFALYMPKEHVEKAIRVAKNLGLTAFFAGYIKAGEKKVVIKPKGLEYLKDTLAVR